MTSETELRHLLDAETGSTTGSATGGAGGWEDVVRRGRHRQRVRRARRLGVAALLAGAVVLAAVLPSDERKLDTTPPAGEHTDTTVDGDPTTPSGVRLPELFRVRAVRAQGAFVTMAMLWERGAFDPCAELRPRVVESSEQVGIELADAGGGRGGPWAGCGSSDGGAWGTLELQDPVGARPVIDLTTGFELTVVDGASLLFPTALPAPFVVEERYEGNGATEAGGWNFHWTTTTAAGGLSELRLSIGALDDDGGACEGEGDRPTAEEIELRGTTARLCITDWMASGPPEGVTYHLSWEEDGRRIVLFYGSFDPAALRRDDLVAIAEGLRPLGSR